MWNNIITVVLTSGTLIALTEIVRDWRNKRREGKVNNKHLDYQAQKEGLDLVSEFYNKVKELTDISNNDLKNELTHIKNEIADIKNEQQNLKEEQRKERLFLNGKYQEFLKRLEQDNKHEEYDN
mgnify:CR=1 FL=1